MNFVKQNWFKLSVLALGVIFIASVFKVAYFGLAVNGEVNVDLCGDSMIDLGLEQSPDFCE